MHVLSLDALLIVLPHRLEVLLDCILEVHSLVPDEFRDAVLVEEVVVLAGVVFAGLLDQLVVVGLLEVVLLNAVQVVNHVLEKTLVLVEYSVFVVFLEFGFLGVTLEALPDEDLINFDAFVELENEFQSLEGGFLRVLLELLEVLVDVAEIVGLTLHLVLSLLYCCPIGRCMSIDGWVSNHRKYHRVSSTPISSLAFR